MTDITNEREARNFFSDEMNNFASMYAGLVQKNMKSQWDIDISHRECWEIITSLISQLFPNEVIEIETMEQLKDKIVTETIEEVREIIIAKYSKLNTIH